MRITKEFIESAASTAAQLAGERMKLSDAEMRRVAMELCTRLGNDRDFARRGYNHEVDSLALDIARQVRAETTHGLGARRLNGEVVSHAEYNRRALIAEHGDPAVTGVVVLPGGKRAGPSPTAAAFRFFATLLIVVLVVMIMLAG